LLPSIELSLFEVGGELGGPAPVLRVEVLVEVVLLDAEGLEGGRVVEHPEGLGEGGPEGLLGSSRPRVPEPQGRAGSDHEPRTRPHGAAEEAFRLCRLSVEVLDGDVQLLRGHDYALLHALGLVEELLVERVCGRAVHLAADLETVVPGCLVQRHVSELVPVHLKHTIPSLKSFLRR